jgi:hypothetical protein
MNSPSAQAMTADPSVVDAAVRFCDDVLASPTVELLKRRESYSPYNKTKLLTLLDYTKKMLM